MYRKKMTTYFIFGIVTDNLLREEVEPDEMIPKSLTLNYVKISVSYLIYHSYIAISPISLFFPLVIVELTRIYSFFSHDSWAKFELQHIVIYPSYKGNH